MTRRAHLLARFSSWFRALFSEPVGFLWGALINAFTTTISYFVGPHAQLAHLMILHLLGAVLISMRYGYAVSTVTAITSVVAFDYFCIPPILAFALPDGHSVVTFVGMLVTALTICALLQSLRRQRNAARASEARTQQLCALSLDLSAAVRVDELPGAAESHLDALFRSHARVLLCSERGTLDLGTVPPTERELAVAAIEQKPEMGEQASGEVAYQRVGSGARPLGLIRLAGCDRSSSDRRILLAACADRIGVAIERVLFGEAARRAHLETETERLRNALLSAVSHDLRTPLSSILTAGTTLVRAEGSAQSERRELLDTIVEEAERLNTIVTNLLSVTRLEAEGVRLKKVPDALDDLVFGALSRLSERLQGRTVDVDAPADLPLVEMDPVLVDLVVANLLENVLGHTPKGSPIQIQLEETGSEVVLWVRDRGPGIPEHERARVFEKFYRGSAGRLKNGGTGLGLTICHAVARVHGGRIGIHARPGGGTSLEFALPAGTFRGDGEPKTASEPDMVFA